jgi:hypothetical protein
LTIIVAGTVSGAVPGVAPGDKLGAGLAGGTASGGVVLPPVSSRAVSQRPLNTSATATKTPIAAAIHRDLVERYMVASCDLGEAQRVAEDLPQVADADPVMRNATPTAQRYDPCSAAIRG